METTFDIKDRIIQNHFPTVMAPKYGKLPECEIGKSRLLMAQDGLYIETNQPWGRLVYRLYEAPRPLPYGDIEECDDFSILLTQALCMLHDEIVPAAAGYAEQNKEWAGWIVWDEQNGLEYMPVTFESTYVRAEVRHPDLPEGRHLVIDVHSHGSISPFFSMTDDEDDKGGVKISLVLGSYKAGENEQTFKTAYRYCVEGFFIGSFEGDGHEKFDSGDTKSD